MNYKVSKEVAEQDFFSWCEANGIDFDTDSMDEESKGDFEKLAGKIVKEVCKGTCVVDGENLEYTVSEFSPENFAGKKVVIKPPAGSVYTAMDGNKDTQQFRKVNGALSAMTGLDVGWFSKISVIDCKFFQAVLRLFLAD